MASNRDKAIWSIAKGEELKIKMMIQMFRSSPETTQSRGGNKWMSADDELKSFTIDPRFKVNCFASEEDFPDIAAQFKSDGIQREDYGWHAQRHILTSIQVRNLMTRL